MASHIIFDNGKLCSFSILQARFHLPQSMYFYYLQLQNIIRAHPGDDTWVQSPIPIFNYMSEVDVYNVFLSRCYYMLLSNFLKDFPSRADDRWEQDVRMFE